jgi:hypothetical protein
MIKLLIGIAIGMVVVLFWPDLLTNIKDVFIGSGVRDTIVESLQKVK